MSDYCECGDCRSGGALDYIRSSIRRTHAGCQFTVGEQFGELIPCQEPTEAGQPYCAAHADG